MDEVNPPDKGVDEYNRELHELRYADMEPAPRRSGKPRTDSKFFIMGFLTPFLLSALASPLGSYTDFGSVAAPLLLVVLFVVLLVLVIVGGRNGDARMVGFGKGGLWAYAAVALAGLLVFGTCAVLLSGSRL